MGFVCLFVCSSSYAIFMHQQGVSERDIALSPPATKPLSHNTQWARSSLFLRVLMGTQTLTLVNRSQSKLPPPLLRNCIFALAGPAQSFHTLGRWDRTGDLPIANTIAAAERWSSYEIRFCFICCVNRNNFWGGV